MKIQCTDNKTFELTDGSVKLGQISYNGLFSSTAQATVRKDLYMIAPTGILSTTIAVTRNGQGVAGLEMNWKGHIIISLNDGQQFVLKATGMLQDKYVLEDKNQQKLIFLDPDFNWSKFNYNYDISFGGKPQDILLVLLATYSANYCVAIMSASL